MRRRFGQFLFDGGKRRLKRGSEFVALAPRPFALLELLLERSPDAVSKDEILQRIWKGAAVSDTALTTAVGELRYALGETALRPAHLRTVHRFGYAIEGDVVEVEADEPRTRAVLVGGEQRIDIDDAEIVLGRHGGPAGDVFDPSVSRHHARLRSSADGFEVEDLDSKNGTFVNGVRVTGRERLADGDELRLGRVSFVLRELVPGAETETRPA